jgi:hypothetical protein
LDGSVLADSVTSRDERGDFSKNKAKGFAIHAGGNVLLFVVKKHASVLRNLIEWARLSAKKTREDGRMVVGDVPLLVIDDEADQASVDIKVQAFDEQTGQPDEEHNPSTINRLIRRLLETFERRAYVGYTATPFANVFIHPEGRTEDEGDDLFPRHFIVNLSAPSDYLGPANVFGRVTNGVPPLGSVPSLVRFIDDADEWVPPRHKNTLVPRYNGKSGVPPSLEKAIRSFVLASAARFTRGQETSHKSMLVHVTRFTAVQHHVYEQVRQVVEDLKTRWRARRSTPTDSLQAEMRRLWESDFIPTSEARGESAPSWGQVEEEVWSVLDRLRVNLINAKASDALVYEEHKQNGLHVIAIGGDKLSRGLTLEGLTVSYFLRSARMYDTLMQMGRWFGYRPGYEDLCRLYLSEEIAEWYGHITEAAEELRLEFDRMVLLGGTPDDYGLRVRTHPVMAITGKLRPGLPTLTTSLSATPFEPTILVENTDKARENWELAERFMSSLGDPDEAPVTTDDASVSKKRGSWPGSICWRHVSGESVLQFLGRFQFADRYLTRTPSSAVKDYIADRIRHDELTQWTVVALGKQARGLPLSDAEPAPLDLKIAGHEISTIYRERQGDRDKRPGFYVVKRLGGSRDEAIDLTTAEWAEVDRLRNGVPDDPQRQGEMTQGRLIREARPRTRGLLILYLLTPEKCDATEARRGSPIVAPYISFPYSPEAEPVSYKLSWRYWEDELAGVE